MAILKFVEELDVFQRAFKVSLEVHKISLTFPKIEQYSLGDQIRRASKSVCANLAEGFEKQSISKPEFKRYVSISLGSSGEMRVWARYCYDLGYIDKNKCVEWREEYKTVSKMLKSLHNKI